MEVPTTAGDVTLEVVHETVATDVSGSSNTATDDKSLTDVLFVGVFRAVVPGGDVVVEGVLLTLLLMPLSDAAERIG